MINARYQVLAYQPYAFCGEWVAVGVLVYAQHERELEFVRAPRFSRAKEMFPNADVDAVRDIYLPHISRLIRLQRAGLPSLGELSFVQSPEQLVSLTKKVILGTDNALVWRPEQHLRGPNIDWIIEHLEHMLFDQHQAATAQNPSDDQIWRHRFKPTVTEEVAHFTSDLDIPYKERVFHFDYGYQNGSLHLVDPTSFILSHPASITRKLDRRYGKYAQLAKAFPEKQYHVYVPAALPEVQRHRTLIRETLEQELRSDNLAVDVYEEHEVAQLKVDLARVLGQ